MLLVVVSTFSTSFLIYLTSVNHYPSECLYLMESRCSKADIQLELTPPSPFSLLNRDSFRRPRQKLVNSLKNTSNLLFSQNSYSALSSQSIFYHLNYSITSGPFKLNSQFYNESQTTFRLQLPTTSPPLNISAILHSIPDIDFVDDQQHSGAFDSDLFDFSDSSLHTELSFSLRSCPQLSALNLSSFPQQRFHRAGPGTHASGPFLLHSAFSDHRADSVVRVVGIAEHGAVRSRGALECLLFYGALRLNSSTRVRVVSIDTVESSGAHMEELPENKGKKCVSSLFSVSCLIFFSLVILLSYILLFSLVVRTASHGMIWERVSLLFLFSFHYLHFYAMQKCENNT